MKASHGIRSRKKHEPVCMCERGGWSWEGAGAHATLLSCKKDGLLSNRSVFLFFLGGKGRQTITERSLLFSRWRREANKRGRDFYLAVFSRFLSFVILSLFDSFLSPFSLSLHVFPPSLSLSFVKGNMCPQIQFECMKLEKIIIL